MLIYSTAQNPAPFSLQDLDPAAAAAVSALVVAPSLPVTQRGPTANDDSTRGYQPTNLWNCPSTRQMWVAVDTTPGHAIWSPLPTGILPLDSVPGVVLHGYGTRRLRAAYAGNPLAVTPSGGSSTDVVFDPTGNVSSNALTALIGAVQSASGTASPQTYTAGVTTWYDQTSGTAANLTVPPAASGQPVLNATVPPQIGPAYLTGGSPFVGFADGGMNWITDQNNPETVIENPRLFNANTNGAISSGLSSLSLTFVARGSYSGVAIQTLAAFGANPSYPFELNTTDTASSFFNSPMLWGSICANVGESTQVPLYLPSSPSVLCYNGQGSSGAFTISVDDRTASGTLLTTGVNEGPFYLGGQDSYHTGWSGGLNAVIIGPTLTTAQQAALRASLTDTFGLTPQVRDTIIVYGASTEVGADGWMSQSPVRYAEPGLHRPYVIYNLANPGATIGSAGTGSPAVGHPPCAAFMFANSISAVVPQSPSALTVGVLGFGAAVNEIAGYPVGGTSPAQTFADWQAFFAAFEAAVPNAVTVGYTTPPHGSITTDSSRLAFNAAVSASNGVVSALCDEAGSPVLGSPSILTNRVATVPGGGHRTPYYQAMEGPLLAAAVNKAAGQ